MKLPILEEKIYEYRYVSLRFSARSHLNPLRNRNGMVAYPINSAPSTETVYLPSFLLFAGIDPICGEHDHVTLGPGRSYMTCFALPLQIPRTHAYNERLFYLPNASSPPELRVKTSLIITSLEYCLRAKLLGADVGMSNYQPIRLCFERDLGRSLFSFLFGTNETQQIRARSRSNRSAIETRWCAVNISVQQQDREKYTHR